MPLAVPRDILHPVLTSSPAVRLSIQQQNYIKEVLDICSSDSRFSSKAWEAIKYILTNGNTPVPSITSLNPSSVVLGSPSFILHVIGTGFAPGSVIYFNGGQEPTTYVSPTEVTTGVNMATAVTPVTVPVQVQNPDGTNSNISNFTFLP